MNSTQVNVTNPIFRGLGGVQDQSTVNFFRLQYEGGKASHPNCQRKEVGDDQTCDLVNLMQEIIRENAKALPTESEFVETIYKAFEVTPEQMENTKCRKRELAQARQWHIYVRFKVFKMSLTVAGGIYKKDHATVLYTLKTVNNLMETDRKFQEKSEDILPLLEKYGIKFIKVQKTNGFNNKINKQ